MLWISKALIHRVVDLLLDMTDQSPAATTAGGWQLLDSFLLQACAQFGFAPAFGSIPLVTRTQVFMERAIVLARPGTADKRQPDWSATIAQCLPLA